MEVLAPAGGRQALEAAVYSGADAVYLGGTAFGARANAQNFTDEQLIEAVAFCRERGVKVHVTVNTVLKDRELDRALAFVQFLCSIPVDAVLVQDMGLFSLLRQSAPELPIHASTQMSLHSPAGVRLIEELGASRAVLSRELSLKEIKEIREGCTIELESFVHGALCMSVSGQCYLSAMLGGRSGNRGMCAQPCRLPFEAKGGTGHDLSLKDLSFIKEIKELEGAGVCSAKIEGRMKRPEYVAAAVSACRKAADGQDVPQELTNNLEAVFSRSGFTRGYLTGETGVSMFGVRTREDVTGATQKVFASLRGLYRGELQRVPVSLELSKCGQKISLTARDHMGNTGIAEAAWDESRSLLSRERCIEQLSKTGGTPYRAQYISVPEQGVGAGVPSINGLRRSALEMLSAQRAKAPSIPFKKTEYRPVPKSPVVPRERLPVRACFRSPSQLCNEAMGCRELVFPIETDHKELIGLRDHGFPPILLELPPAMFGLESKLRKLMERRMEQGFVDFVCTNLGGLGLCRELGAAAHGSHALNIGNTQALKCFEELGMSSAEISFELTCRELQGLGETEKNMDRGIMVYGRQTLMLTRNCPLANSPRGCLDCREPGYLVDRKNIKFPVMCRPLTVMKGSELLNSLPLWLGDREKDMNTVDFGVFRFTVENSVECAHVLELFFRQKTPDFDYTRGLFSRGVE